MKGIEKMRHNNPHKYNSTSSVSRNSSSAESKSSDGSCGKWNTPMPYLFVGLGLMLGLIAVALIILACSFRRQPSNSSSNSSPPAAQSRAVPAPVRAQPKPVAKHPDLGAPDIVVILAGQTNPTHLANPLSSSPSLRAHVQPL